MFKLLRLNNGLVEYNSEYGKVLIGFWLRKAGYGVMEYMFGILESVDINNEKEIIRLAEDIILSNIEEHISIYEESYVI